MNHLGVEADAEPESLSGLYITVLLDPGTPRVHSNNENII